MDKTGQLEKNEVTRQPGASPVLRVPEKIDFEATVDLYQTPLLRYVGHLIGAKGHEAEDVVQDTFLRLHRKMDRDGPSGISNLQVWLYRVAHNLVMDVGRKRRREKKKRDGLFQMVQEERKAVTEVEILGEIIRREVCERAMEELQKLPGELKHVVLLKVIQGMTMSQIAGVLGISASNVCYRLGRALWTISGRLKEAGLI